MPNDQQTLDEEQQVDPMEQAAATASLVQQMKQEEASLPYGGTQPYTQERTHNIAQSQTPAGQGPMKLNPDYGVNPAAMLSMQKYEATQNYQKAREAGMPENEALSRFGPAMFGRPMPAAPASKYIRGANGEILQEGPQGLTQVRPPNPPPPEMQTVTEVTPAVKEVPGSPGVPGSKGLPVLGWGSQPAIPAVPAQAAKPEIRTTRKVPISAPGSVQPPATAGTGTIPPVVAPPNTLTTGPRQAMGGYKIGTTYRGGLKYIGGDPKLESSWEKTK
jgi:hypothetical protein